MGITNFKQKRTNLEKSRVDDFNSVFDLYNEYNKHVQIKMKKLFEFSDYDIEEWLNERLDNNNDSDYFNLLILPWKAYKSPCWSRDIVIAEYTADYISDVLDDIDNQLYSYHAKDNYLILLGGVEKEQLDRLHDYFIIFTPQGSPFKWFTPRIDIALLEENMIKWVDDVKNSLEAFGLKVIDVLDSGFNIDDSLRLHGRRRSAYCSDGAKIVSTYEIIVKNPMKE